MGEKVNKYVQIPADVVSAVQEMCERYGTTFTFELVDALRRHVAYPPERKPEPLPVAQNGKPRKPAKKGKK